MRSTPSGSRFDLAVSVSGCVFIYTACPLQEEYVQRFELGVSSVSSDPLPSPSPSSRSRKRSLSQANLDSFLSPSGEVKRSRPASLNTGSKHKKGKKTPHKTRRRSGHKSRTPSKKQKSQTPKTPRSPKTPKTPRSHMEALKVLNKAKKFRQMDLKKSVVIKSGLSREELDEMQRKVDEERRRWKEVWEQEKMRRREERIEKLRALQEQKRLERLRQKEMMKPREDTLCTDSKVFVPRHSSLSSLSLSLSLSLTLSLSLPHTHKHTPSLSLSCSLSPSLSRCVPSCRWSCLDRQ